MTALLGITAGLTYLVVGLFVSRHWWRLDPNPDDSATPIIAFGIAALWPAYLLAVPVYMAIRAFYGTHPTHAGWHEAGYLDETDA